MLFPKIDSNVPTAAGALLIAEYVQVAPQTEIPKLVDAVARYYISEVESSGRYSLRGVSRSISGDLRTVAFLWQAQSAGTAVEVGLAAQHKIDASALALISGGSVSFLEPTQYDARRGDISEGKSSLGGISIFAAERQRTDRPRCYESDGDIPCALHDEILLKPGTTAAFLAAAADLLQSFECETGWTFAGAGVDLKRADRLMHFWRMVGIGTIPRALTCLADIPAYAVIQDFIQTEVQNVYMMARKDLPIGSVPGDNT